MILEDYIEQHARLHPHKTAIVCGEEKYSYAELWDRVSQRMEELKHIDRGQICCLRAVTSIDFLVSYFALHQVGVLLYHWRRACLMKHTRQYLKNCACIKYLKGLRIYYILQELQGGQKE